MRENINENLNNYKTFVVEYFVKLKYNYVIPM